MNKEKKLIKVVMEFENGDKEYIEGDDAKNWNEALNGAILIDFAHGAHAQEVLKNINWKKMNE